jgi:hypothetical protein
MGVFSLMKGPDDTDLKREEKHHGMSLLRRLNASG